MTIRRVILPNLTSPQAGSSFRLDPEAAHYLVRVLRLTEGDLLEVCDGNSMLWLVRLLLGEDQSVQLVWVEPLASGPSLFPVYLAQAMPKGDKFEQILQKCTELGVSGFFPFFSSRCVVRPKPDKVAKKLQRWEKIVREASRQSERTTVPEIAAPVSMNEMIQALPPGLPRLVCWASESNLSLKQWCAQHPDAPGVVVVVGPEGGFSEPEVEEFASQSIVSVGLGSLILRTETAGPAVSGLLQYLYGSFGEVSTSR